MNPFDTQTYRRARVENPQAEFAWRNASVAARSPEERTAWQSEFRQRVDELLGGLSGWERPPLDAIVTATQQLDGYRRETVEFTTRPGLRAFGYFLIPDECKTPRPTVLCLHGHGIGADGIVGIVEEEYGQSFAVQCVQRGYPTFALEQISFGRRRDAQAQAAGAGVSSCTRDTMAALMLGETMAGWRTWDAIRALDYLESRSEVVDTARLAAMGISGGGTTTFFTSVLDTRVSAAVVSGYFNTFAGSILAVDHCVDNFVPGILTLGEMPDLAALIAPRLLFVENGKDDPIFPVAAFEQAVEQTEEVYAAFGVPQNFASEIFDGGHRFHGVGAFEFLTKVFLP